ncbi:hypothetical protein IM792_07220 [Mucilaginibacter sp. JRF]|uniref:glycosyltransferase family 2 protein n=1 Tax=Mucilaginibacter sp. JRF TaxID=2780088 RepID=UPI00187F97AF|nr:galactosyltransferase-related protein [Mucilaginibacter sp. JRF]MBE9584231.1 hypothetical protein [Mucilaginibacter sp. JRF]
MKGISVVVIVRERYEALCRTMQGLAVGPMLPNELIIVHMNQAAYSLPNMPFPVRQISVYSNTNLPLAASRNAGIAIARHNRVVFLDVDCIPAMEMLMIYDQQWEDDQLLSGQVRYLSAGFGKNLITPENLMAHSITDPIRSGLVNIPYELFWSLNFGCSKVLFTRIGGFDKRFKGYGGEDTDFAFEARKNNVQIKNVPAIAYHQYHSSYSPPLNHLSDIITNANLFYSKWQIWPMDGWLMKFKEAGLIYWENNLLKLLRTPDESELQNSMNI